VVVVVGAVVVVDDGGGLEPEDVDAPGAVVVVDAGGLVPPRSCCACATLDCALLIFSASVAGGATAGFVCAVIDLVVEGVVCA
jgi:hypothetical protein